jgi:hypothetical protein
VGGGAALPGPVAGPPVELGEDQQPPAQTGIEMRGLLAQLGLEPLRRKLGDPDIDA